MLQKATWEVEARWHSTPGASDSDATRPCKSSRVTGCLRLGVDAIARLPGLRQRSTRLHRDRRTEQQSHLSASRLRPGPSPTVAPEPLRGGAPARSRFSEPRRRTSASFSEEEPGITEAIRRGLGACCLALSELMLGLRAHARAQSSCSISELMLRGLRLKPRPQDSQLKLGEREVRGGCCAGGPPSPGAPTRYSRGSLQRGFQTC